MKIKRKRLVHCWDTRLIDSDKHYTGFIIYNHNRLTVINNNKQLINMSYIYLSDGKFPFLDKKIELSEVSNELESTFNVKSSNIKDIGRIYSIPNVTIFIVVLKRKEIDFSDKYNWVRYMDLYNTKADLYESILHQSFNRHINIKLKPDSDVLLYFKIKQLYKYMIGSVCLS